MSDDNVRSLRGDIKVDRLVGQVNPELVEFLEKALERARAGDIGAFIGSFTTRSNEQTYGWSCWDNYSQAALCKLQIDAHLHNLVAVVDEASRES